MGQGSYAPDTKFLVPPSQPGFRVFSERTSWVDWKDYTSHTASHPILRSGGDALKR